MKTKCLLLTLFSLACLACPGFGQVASKSPSGDEQEIRKIEQEWLDAIVKRDASYVEKIEADDYTVTGPLGRTLNKQEDVKDTTSGETTFEKMAIDDLKVRLYGDTAIANGIATVKAKTKGKNESGRYAWTDVFVKTNGEWKAVSGQVTAIARDEK